ncbi:centromere protein C isoform 1-T1 [Dugong dugon]
MAASGLDHLKNDYRRRFCRPSRAPDINMEQGQNILEILQDCFEEKSLANDFSTDSTKSVPYSTPKIKDTCIQSPNKERQKSHPKALPPSSRKKEGCLQLVVEPNEDVSKSVQAHEVYQKILATDVGSENSAPLKNVSSRKQNDHHNEADEEFYLSVGSSSVVLDAKTSLSQNAVPSIAQKRETYTSENSLNMLSSNTESSCKTKKRLNFEDILKKVEIEDKVLEGPQARKPSGRSQKRTQDSGYEIQPQAKKRFSVLFLETVKRKTESSSVIRHVAADPPHSTPNDVMLEDEFIIDESDISFGSQSLIKIPRNVKPPKQCTVSPIESTVVLQGKKSRKKHHNVTSETLTSDKNSYKANPEEKAQPSEGKKVGESCALADKMEKSCKSTKDALYSENTEKSSENKGTIKQNRRRKVKANVVEEQLDMEQPRDKNINTSLTTQDKLQRNSDKSTEVCEEMRNDHISKTQMTSVGKKKSRTHVPIKENQKKVKEEFKNKYFSNGPKKKNLVPEEATLTITKSQRISRRPSNWWEVTSEHSPVGSSSSLIKNELPLHHKSRQKLAEKNQSSKNTRRETTAFKRRKTATQGSSRAQTFLNAKDSGGIIDHDEISSSQNESLESDEANLAKKKHLDCSGATGSSQNQHSSDSISAEQNVRLKSQTSGYTWKKGSDSKKLGTSVLEGSGPSKLQKYMMSGKNNSDMGRKEAQESSDDSRVKRSKVILENKIHHKLVLPSNTPNVRRTKRTRLKPLEYWRGERIDYQASQSGGFVVGGILSPDTVSPRGKKANRKTGKVNKITNKKRICHDSSERKNKLVENLNIPLGDPFQPTTVKDPETRESILMDLVRPRDTYQFFVEHEELRVYKTLDTPFFSTGKLILGPCQEKGKQHVGLDTLVFYVDFGDLLCTLHETPYLITTGDSFYVPSGNYYNIKNLLNEESVLLFTQIKR